MSYIVEVTTTEDGSKLLVNLDNVVKITKRNGAISGPATILHTVNNQTVVVHETYEQFKQFAVQTVTEDDFKNKVSSSKPVKKEKPPVADIFPKE